MSVKTETLRRWMAAKARYDELKAELDDAKADRDALQDEIYEAMEHAGDRSLTRDIGAPYGSVRFVPNKTVYGIVYDDEAFLEYVNETAQTDELSKPAWRKRQVNELVRRALATGESLPPGVEFTETRYVTPTRLKS